LITTFFFVKVVVCWFILSWLLIYLDIFLPENCCMLVFSSRNMMHTDFCTWNFLHVDYFFKKLKISWILSLKNLLYFYFFFVKLADCWFLLFVILVHRSFSWWNQFCSWNLLRADFCSLNLIYFDVFFRETCCMLINSFVKLNLSWYFSSGNFFYSGFFFMKHDACSFLFVKLVAGGLFLQ